MSGWVGFDLDGTLAKHPAGRTDFSIGEPVMPMVNRLLAHVRRGDDVRIFTARAGFPAQKYLIQNWLEKHGMPRLEVTATKDIDMVMYYDDLAISVERDTGLLKCPNCAVE